VARELLARLSARAELVAEVCDIIGHHHHPQDAETTNFKVVYDADTLANLEEKSQELRHPRQPGGEIPGASY